jgi:RNAse (barnase) inhibitor barstar
MKCAGSKRLSWLFLTIQWQDNQQLMLLKIRLRQVVQVLEKVAQEPTGVKAELKFNIFRH